MQPKVSKRTGAKTRKKQTESAENQEEIVKFELNFFLLQESARMDLTRSLDNLTSAIVECKSSVIVAANQDNFMHLIAHLRDPELLIRSSIHNVPYTNTFLDYVRWENSESRVTRYPWDQAVRYTNIATIQSFLRFQLKSVKRGSNASSHTKEAAWEDGKSLIMDLIIRVTKTVHGLDKHLKELRDLHVYLSFAAWNNRDTLHDNDVDVIFSNHSDMFQTFKLDSCAKIFRRTGTVQFCEQPAALDKQDEEKESLTETLRRECKEKMIEYIELPYTYDLIKDFLMTEEKYNKGKIPMSIGRKMTELATSVKEAIQFLVTLQNKYAHFKYIK